MRIRFNQRLLYPELEDINGYETEDNKLNDYGSQQANEAHIDNMIQRYKRLTVGSLDPDNVKRYRERLNYWEAQKAEIEKAETVDNNSESGIINKKALYTYDDPLREVLGSAEESNYEDIIRITEEFKKIGVVFERPNDEKLCYEQGLKHGEPGIVCISKGASYGAWLHERQHVIDDYNEGWLGFRIFEKPEKCIQRERTAYDIEIKLAKKIGREDIAERLEELCQNEIKKYKR